MASTQLDKVLAINVAIRDCSLIEIWEQDFDALFRQFDLEEKIHSHNSYESMGRAALLFSLIALRKIADFAENRGKSPDDIRLKDFALDLKAITGEAEIIDQATRDKINKGIAHITAQLDPDVDEMEELRKVLSSKADILKKLGDAFFAMIG